MPAKKTVVESTAKTKKNKQENQKEITTNSDDSTSTTDKATSSNHSCNNIRKSRSERADVTFSVGRVHRELKKGRYASRIGSGAPVYLAGVMDYLVSELTELAGQAAKDNNKKRISPRHLMMAIKNDDEIDKLLSGVTIASGGVQQKIHPALLPKMSKAREKSAKGVKKKPDQMEIEENEE